MNTPDPGNKGEHEPEDSVEDPRNAQPWMKLAGLGMELAGSTLSLMFIGYLIDRFRGHDDRLGIAIGALVGFAFGMLRFIQKAMREIDSGQ